MSWDDIRQACVVLEVVGIVLLLALLVTPAPKHAIVNALAIAAILRSICAVIPSLAYQRFRSEFDHIMVHAILSDFCIGFAIVLRYLTVVKAAFTVSFTLPLLYLAVQHSRFTGLTSSSHSAFYRSTIGFLCVGPFIWALPTILVTVPTIVHDRDSLKPMFYQATCTITNTPYQVVSLSLMIFALLVAAVISMTFVYIMWGHIRLPLLSRSLGMLDLTRILRFGALLGIIILSTVLYTVVMATWARDRVNRFSPRPMATVFSISVLWEAATPILMFIIFGAQEDVLEIWSSWYHCLRRGSPFRTSSAPAFKPQPEESCMEFARPAGRPRRDLFRQSVSSSRGEVILDIKQVNVSETPNGSFWATDPTRDHDIGSRPHEPQGMVPPPPTCHVSRQTHGTPLLINASSLLPPPRPARRKNEGPTSLTAFKFECEARPFMRPGRHEVPDRGAKNSGDDGTFHIHARISDVMTRPNTGETSGTFGECP